MKKPLYPCATCIHNHSLGCLYQIDKGISTDFISKKGKHEFCHTTINNFCDENTLAERREKAKRSVKAK